VRELFSVRTRTWRYPFGSSAIVGSYVASGGNPVAASRRAARTRGFAAPAFAGCAIVVGFCSIRSNGHPRDADEVLAPLIAAAVEIARDARVFAVKNDRASLLLLELASYLEAWRGMGGRTSSGRSLCCPDQADGAARVFVTGRHACGALPWQRGGLKRQMHTLDSVLDALNRHHQRATYGAVAGLLGKNPRSLLQGRERDWRHSWVVNQDTGMPSEYASPMIHPGIAEHAHILETQDELEAWLADSAA